MVISVRLHLPTCVHQTHAVVMVIAHRIKTEGRLDVRVIQATKVASVKYPSTCVHRIPVKMVELVSNTGRDFIVHVRGVSMDTCVNLLSIFARQIRVQTVVHVTNMELEFIAIVNKVTMETYVN